MKIFGGLASTEYLEHYSQAGVSGILTNPQGMALYSRGRLSVLELVEDVCERTPLPIWIQVHGPNAAAIVTMAERVVAVAPERIGVKIIAGPEGYVAVSTLVQRGVRCIVTSVFSLNQALVAASVGASGICPFITRGQEEGLDMNAVLRSICETYQRRELTTEVIAASISSHEQVEMAALCGATGIALRWPILRDMMMHPLSNLTAERFGPEWRKIPGEDVAYLGAEDLRGAKAE